ncbi:MAG TPA: 3'-5' exonuclease [Candidatus Moranbacteria bacterium]|nr:3'-5' exonuclease [Candidatus Moranbacteria bacterium]
MPKIVFDIETAGEDFEKMDQTTQNLFRKKAEAKSNSPEELERELAKIKEETVFSPLTAQIVAVGVLDVESEKGAVYYQNLKDTEEKEENGIKFKPLSEEEILENFWRVAESADTFISFNGRGFDAPFLMLRSAVHRIRPSKNLLANRYLNAQPTNAKHIDLMEQLNFYGATWGKVNLHMACRAFGIKSPKADGVNGDDVTRLFGEGKYLEIAQYNSRDLSSTAELYRVWKEYIAF